MVQIWNVGGGHFHSKNRLVFWKQHEAMYTLLFFLLIYIQCGMPASWALPCVLIRPLQINSLFPTLLSGTLTCERAVHFHHSIGSFFKPLLQPYKNSLITFLACTFLHHLCCSNNAHIDLCQFDSTFTCMHVNG